ncbi:DUF2971 domain-containing protein [Paracoccus sp. XHP0099]|uniref:DUF2971 domain-containing protein n=2 Tax=Paracoccus marinaquae TaxID=2841926 RepID=A0ABS6AMH1_9RHOB|nr:DUF2971 domain-containing protein [Paracoccus marinaquae]
MVYEFDDSAIQRGDFLNPVRVRYAEERPLIAETDILRFGSRLSVIKDSEVSDRVFKSIWLTKSVEWSYEREWRIINHRASGYVRVESLKPVEIICGCGIAKDLREKIISTVSDTISVKQVILDKERFALKLSGIST